MNRMAIKTLFSVFLSGVLAFFAASVLAQQLFVRPGTGGTAVRVGETRDFNAWLTRPDGSIQQVTANSWNISNGGPATVDSSGNVTGTATPSNALAVLTATFSDAGLTGGVTLSASQNLTIQASQDVWTGGGGPAQGGDVRSIVNTGTGAILAPIFGGGIYRTTTGAGGWEPSYYGIPFSGSAEVRSVSVAPDNSIVAAVEGSGVYRSTNGGASWAASNSGMGCNFPRNFDASNFSGALYVAANCGVYKSTNSGGNWFSVSTGLPAGTVNSIQSFNSSNTVWITIVGSGLYRSTDGGSTWSARNNGIPLSNGARQVYDFVQPANASNVQLAMVEGAGIYRSTNNGANWVPQNSGLPPGAYGFQGGIGTPGDGYLYVALDGQGIFRGTTGANTANNVTWTAWGNTATQLPTVRTRTPRRVDGVYYVPTGRGVYISANDGVTWTPLKAGLPGGYIINTVTDPGNTNLVYAAGDGVYKSTSGGAAWVAASNGITGAVSRGQRGGAGNIMRGGDGALYVSTVNDGVFKSVDNAVTWTPVNNGLPYLLGQGMAVRSDPVDAQTIYALFSSDALGVYRSVDGGANWVSITGDLPAGNARRTRKITKDTASGNLYLATNGGVYKSVNGGTNWTPIYTATGANHVRIDTGTTPSTVYWSTYVNNAFNQPQTSSGVYKSVNEGASYAQILSGRLVQNFRLVRAGGWLRLYVASQNLSSQLNQSRVLKSVDGGVTWESVSAGMRHQFVNSFDTVNNALMRASTTGGGVYNFSSTESTSLAAARTGVQNAVDAMMGIVNGQGNSLDYTQLAPLFDANFFNDGGNATLAAKEFASDVRGATLSNFNITGISSFDEASGVISVQGTITTPQGVETIGGDDDGIFIFKRQPDGTYKMYGNQRIARAGAQVEMRTDYGPSYNVAPRQHVNFHIEAQQGVLSTAVNAHSVTATPNAWPGLLPLNTQYGNLRINSYQASPPPAPPEEVTSDAFYGGFDPGATQVASGTLFQFTLKKANDSTVTYNVPFTGTALNNPATDAITNVTINSGTATSFVSSTFSSPLNLAWTQPTSYAVQDQWLYGYVQNSDDVQCSVDQDVANDASSGQITLPTTCGTAPIVRGGINVTTEGAEGSGKRSNFIYNFDITGGVPAAPAGVTPTPFADGSIQVSWNAVSGATSYNLYMATVSGVTKTNYTSLGGHAHTGITSTTYTHPAGAAPGTTYYMVVTAVGAGGESAESAQVSATIPAAGAPAVALSASTLNFGNQTVGVPSANQSVTITNTGAVTLNISDILNTASTEFVMVGNTCGTPPATLAPSASCTLTLSFVASATGPRSATLSFVDDAAGSPHGVGLSGTGVTSDASAMLFVRPAAGTSVRVGETRNFFAVLAKPDGTIINPLTGANFSISSGPATVDASGNVTGTSTVTNAQAVLSATYTDATHTGGVTLTATQTLTIQASQDVWTGGGGPAQGGDVRSVSLTGGAILAPVYGGGIYRTTSGAGGWEPSYYGLPRSGSARVRSVRGPLADGSIVAAVEGSGIYRSTNGGASWASSNSGMGCNFPRSFSYRQANNSLYVAANCGVYKSTSNGASWSSVSTGLPAGTVTSVVAFTSSDTVWVIVRGSGIYRSTDGGASWSARNSGLPAGPNGLQVYSFTSPFSSAVTLAMVEGAGIYRSTNFGASWFPQNNGLPAAYGFQSGIGSLPDGYLYVSIDGHGIYRGTTGASTGNPVTWTAWDTTATQLPALRTRTPSLINGVYYVATGRGVYTSADGGANWTAFKSGLPGGYVRNTVTDPGNTNIVYAAADTVYKSTDGGATWARAGGGISSAVSGGQRTDGGNIARSSDGTLYVSTADAGIFRSTDAAATWTPVNTGLPALIGQGIGVRNDPVDAQTVYALFSSDPLGVYRSVDGGANWVSITGDLPAGNAQRTREITKDAATGNLYLATNGGVYKSVNGGTNWTPVYTATSANHVRIDTGTMPSTVYWSTSVASSFNSAQASSGVYKSTDQGATHSQILSNRLIQNLRVVRPAGGSPRLYALSWNITSNLNQSRVLKSLDGGATWQSVYAGLRHAFVNSLDVANDQVVHASTLGSGVFTFASADPVGDTQAPTVPTGLTVLSTTTSEVNLSWTASSDNVGVSAYKVYRDGVQVGTQTVTGFTDMGLTPATVYTYTVTACDAAGNCSGQSSSASTSTQALPDTQAPTVPANVTATAVSAAQINLAWTASSDNVGVSGYKVFRNDAGSSPIATPAGTSYSNSGLTAATAYSYTVAACDAAGNCSAPSAVATATTLEAGSTAFSPQILAKWNLLGNTGTVVLDVTALFGTQDAPIAGVSQYVLSVWKWVVDPGTGAGRWAFFTPSMTKAESDAAALEQGYAALSMINPGEGFWVNRTTTPGLTVPVSLSGPSSAPFYYDPENFSLLKKPAWHLIATDSPVEPSVFNNSDVNPNPPSPGLVPTNLLQTLWAWSASLQKWYFYSTAIEANGYTSATDTQYVGLDAVRQAAEDVGYLDFHTATPTKTLGTAVGFWVRR